MDIVAEQCKEILLKHYGERLTGVVLYGSRARGDADWSSDLDLLILLKKPFDWFHELDIMIHLLTPLQLETEYLISAKPVAEDEYQNGMIQLYRNVKEEGVLV